MPKDSNMQAVRGSDHHEDSDDEEPEELEVVYDLSLYPVPACHIIQKHMRGKCQVSCAHSSINGGSRKHWQ